MQTTPTSGSRAAWPLAALCCLGLVLFLICATIVIALIPVYLSARDVARAGGYAQSTRPFYARFNTEVPDNGNFLPGQGTNLANTKKAFTSSNDVRVNALSANNNAVARRKRGWHGERRRRTIPVTIIIEIQFVAIQCNTKCIRDREDFLIELQKLISRLCDITIDPGVLGNVTTTAVILNFKDLTGDKPSDFRPIATSDTFICIKDGDFNDPSIWQGGFLPAGRCKIVIPAGRRVTISRESLRGAVQLITVAGTLILGAGSSTFTFLNAINIRVVRGGTVQDATSSKRILLPLGSIVYAFTGATFCQAGTVIQSYSPAGPGNSITITKPTGPVTIAVLPNGDVIYVTKIVFIAISSGGFTSGTTFMGGLAPTAADCADSPCGVSVLSGVILSTADLNGVLDINIDVIEVAPGATLQLGTPGSPNGFKFKFPVQLNIAGVLAFVASGGGIFLPPGSGFNILAGGLFTSVVATFIQVYDPLTGANIGLPTALGLSISGPYFVTISSTGAVTIGIILPGGLVVLIPGVISSTPAIPTTTTPLPTPLMNG